MKKIVIIAGMFLMGSIGLANAKISDSSLLWDSLDVYTTENPLISLDSLVFTDEDIIETTNVRRRWRKRRRSRRRGRRKRVIRRGSRPKHRFKGRNCRRCHIIR